MLLFRYILLTFEYTIIVYGGWSRELRVYLITVSTIRIIYMFTAKNGTFEGHKCRYRVQIRLMKYSIYDFG